ncbi:MAG TPA: DUF4276 family protein [Blastocatellia bacterium]|nr:DUF4276 family protein [Blastocatellia bacterium]
MNVAVLVEESTETAFKETLRDFLRPRLDRMPKLHFIPYDGRLPKGSELRRRVEKLLDGHDAVVALTDVYTGSSDFTDAADAKTKMRLWVGDNANFYAHAAQYEFEAWLLPFWPAIQRLAGHNKSAPQGQPEQINHTHPPSARIKEIFELGTSRDSYVKPRDAKRILKGKDLLESIQACPELKAFVNTIISLSGGTIII